MFGLTRASLIVVTLLAAATTTVRGFVSPSIAPKKHLSSSWSSSSLSTSPWSSPIKDGQVSRTRRNKLVSSFQRLVSKKAMLFLVAFTLCLSLYRDPVHAVGDDENQVVPLQQEITVQKSSSVNKGLFIAAGVSGATFKIARRKRHRRDDEAAAQQRPTQQKKDDTDTNFERETITIPQTSSESAYVGKDEGAVEMEKGENSIVVANSESGRGDNSVSNETPSNDQFIHLAITSASNSVENDIGATTKNDDKDSNNGLETNDSTKEKLTRVVDETIDMASPFHNSKFISSRQQPKPKVEEEKLAQKYAQITSISERAYQILVDLGMLEKI